jgi:hypothetical protein
MDFMLDIETLGTKPGAVVLSVGVIAFERNTGKERAEFYRAIDLRSSRKSGLHVDADTMLWWFKQNQEAQKAALLAPDASPLEQVVLEFKQWFMKHRTRENSVWSQGLDFDVPIWARAMAAVGERPPWEFWSGRDTRTLYDIAGFDPRTIKRKGVYHNALDDARHQVRCLRIALDRLSPDEFLNG